MKEIKKKIPEYAVARKVLEIIRIAITIRQGDHKAKLGSSGPQTLLGGCFRFA